MLSLVVALADAALLGILACVAPGHCSPPVTTYSKVLYGPAAGIQWEISGGFCGSWSLQQIFLAHGAYISQDLVRKANKKWSGPRVMHGNERSGYEVLPINVAFTVSYLKFAYDEWDWNSTKPQAAAYKKWMKRHLVQGSPLVWFPMCKGDNGDGCYGGPGCPNGGNLDHVEPVFGIFSNHSFDDPEVYPDDWVLHASDQDDALYYRPMATLEDSPTMEGNCKNAQAYPGRNEMYPCFDESVTYGLAVTGLSTEGSVQTALKVDIHSEPNTRLWQRAVAVHGTVYVSGLQPGSHYALYRYNSTAAVPERAPYADSAMHVEYFLATANTWTWVDPQSFSSAAATYYVTAPV